MPFVQKIGYLCDKQLIVKMMGISKKKKCRMPVCIIRWHLVRAVKGNIATETDFVWTDGLKEMLFVAVKLL